MENFYGYDLEHITVSDKDAIIVSVTTVLRKLIEELL